MRPKIFGYAFVMILVMAATTELRADIIVGLPANSQNCYPFGCEYNGEYQQVYSATQFSGPITITSLGFFYDLEPLAATNSGNFTISLSTTPANWNTLSPVFANNVGADNTTVFSAFVPSRPITGGDMPSFVFATPFTYNPSNGNLLMDVLASNTSASGGFVYFGANQDNNFMGRRYVDPASGGDIGYGLVTDFSGTNSVVPEAPEPATWLWNRTPLSPRCKLEALQLTPWGEKL